MNYTKDKKSKSNQDNPKSITSETDEFEYLCRDKVHILGFVAKKIGNIIRLNGNDIGIGIAPFLLFLRLVQESKKGQGGWVNVQDLEEVKILSDTSRHQNFSNLRTALKAGLLEGDALSFIQNDGAKNYRISNHPDLISYDRNRLMAHPDDRIRKIAKELP